MKLATIRTAGGQSRPVADLSSIRPGLMLDLAAADPALPANMRAILEGGLLGRAAALVAAELQRLAGPEAPGLPEAGRHHLAEDITWQPPVLNPGKMIMVGSNYKAHLKENVNVPGGQPEKADAKPHEPHAFPKLPQTMVGHLQPVRLSPHSTQFDYETELCVVIGTRCKAVKAEDYRSVIAGYTILNDASSRNLQYKERVQGMFVFGKNLDATAPCGPWMTTDDAIGNPEDLRLRCLVNGEVRQDETTANMIFPIGELIAHCSRDLTLEPGDMIATGCPAGCGIFFDPPEAGLLHDGDLIEMEIENIGTLSNRVCAPHPAGG